MANYEYFYPGGSYPLSPTYGDLFTGYRIKPGELGAPTSTQTANQIQEVSNLLNQGIKVVELQPISPEIFEQIPKQHFKEIKRLTKLTGSEATMHAPMIDPAGFTREGWSEASKDAAERQLKSIIERSHDLSPEGNMPITIHASGISGTEYAPGKEGVETKRIIAINQDTKQLSPVQREERIYPRDVERALKAGEEVKPRITTPEEELDIINKSEWHQNLTQSLFYKQRGDEVIEIYYPQIKNFWRSKLKMAGQERRQDEQTEAMKRLADAEFHEIPEVRQDHYNKYAGELPPEELHYINDLLSHICGGTIQLRTPAPQPAVVMGLAQVTVSQLE